jgi:hypothetical protein
MKVITNGTTTRVVMDPKTEARRDACTKRAWLRIAQLKIDSFGLDCTPEEYLEECKRRNMGR